MDKMIWIKLFWSIIYNNSLSTWRSYYYSQLMEHFIKKFVIIISLPSDKLLLLVKGYTKIKQRVEWAHIWIEGPTNNQIDRYDIE